MHLSHRGLQQQRGALPNWSIALVLAVLALVWVELYATAKYGPSNRQVTPREISAAGMDGWLDEPFSESVAGTRLSMRGWALAPEGIARVEIRVDGQVYVAQYGVSRDDVGKARPGYPDNPLAGFTFDGEFADLSPMHHVVTVVAISKAGGEKVLGRRSLIPPAAKTQWDALLEERPRLASRVFYYLMMTSGVTLGGANEIKAQYADFQSQTQRVGMSVPLLYMRTTKGRDGDWDFDPSFDLNRKCGQRRIADDNLDGILAAALERNLPVNIILNGGIWGDASCETPDWDLTDNLEQDPENCQWDQNNEVHPDNFVKDPTGSVSGTQLSNSLTYHVYATRVREYKRRNLQAAARQIAALMSVYPERFIGVTLDADTYMNPFLTGAHRFDYNPGMLRQFRDWLQGTGPYAGRGGPGVPDLRTFRRPDPLTLEQVNQLSGKAWKSWDEVDPPRELVGIGREPIPEEAVPFWEDPWYLEWDSFRRHIVHLHYTELARWVHEAGVPSERIFSAQAFIAPDPGLRPVSIFVRGPTPDYDSAGVSIEGSVPRDGHLGTIMYGLAAEDRHGMENGRGLYSNIARFDEGWAIVEYNATDLKMPKRKPDYEASYRAYRSAFNYDARQIAMMAWNGSNGIFERDPDFLPYTAFRNTSSEKAMKDAMIARANLPRGARIWTFGAADFVTDDGWTASRGALEEGYGRIRVLPHDGLIELVSPPDQAFRPNRLDLAIVESFREPRPEGITVLARENIDDPWLEIGRSQGSNRVPLHWPAAFRDKIVSQIRLDLSYSSDVEMAHVNRIVLYPAETAFSEAGAPTAQVNGH